MTHLCQLWWGDLMKYIKYGHGKWVLEGWKVNFSMKGLNKVAPLIEELIKKALSDSVKEDNSLY